MVHSIHCVVSSVMANEQDFYIADDRNVQVISLKNLTNEATTAGGSGEEIGGEDVNQEGMALVNNLVNNREGGRVRIDGNRNGISNESSNGEVDEVYTVEDAINILGFGPFQILVTIFAGMIWMADAMELMLLSVLSPIVTCDWDLENYQEALITSIIFVGIMIGGLLWGPVVDNIGRKKALLIMTIEILIFGLASAAAPEYYTFLLFRCLAGVGLGGTAQAVTYYVEFLPRKMRGVCVVLLEVWWAIGSIFAALVALAVIPNIPDPIDASIKYYSHINWRIYLALCTLPMALVLVFFIFVPESARYYIIQGKNKKGEEVIARIARMNFKSPPPGRLVSQEEKERLANLRQEEEQETNSTMVTSAESAFTANVEDEQSAPLLDGEDTSILKTFSSDNEDDEIHDDTLSRTQTFTKKVCELAIKFKNDISLLFVKGMWRTSLLLIVIWIGCTWLYYGAILLTTTILETGYDPHCGQVNRTLDSGCQNLTTDYYLKIVWTTSAEFPGMFVTLIIIEIIGRKITISIEFVGAAIFYGILLICVPNVWLTIFLFGVRAFVTGVFQAVYVYTPEVYPTAVRGVAMGVMTSTARVGGLVSPFVAQALFPVSDYATLILYSGSAVILAVLALLLPIETKGRSLKDSKG